MRFRKGMLIGFIAQPTYAVSQCLLSSRSVASPHDDQPFRTPTNGIEGQDGRNQVTGKRKRTNPGSSSKESSSRCNGLVSLQIRPTCVQARPIKLILSLQPQYAVPASFQSPQIVHYSPPSQALQTPPSNDIDNQSRIGPNIPVNSRSESVYLTPGAPCEAQSRSPHSVPGTVRQRQEQLHAARTPAPQFLNYVPNFVYQSTDKDAAMKHNYFGEYTVARPSDSPLTLQFPQTRLSFQARPSQMHGENYLLRTYPGILPLSHTVLEIEIHLRSIKMCRPLKRLSKEGNSHRTEVLKMRTMPPAREIPTSKLRRPLRIAYHKF